MSQDIDPERMFSTQEIILEERRMARERYRRKLLSAAFWTLSLALGIVGLYLMATERAAIWPHWVEASAPFPLSPETLYSVGLFTHGFLAVHGAARAAYQVHTRAPPNDEEWTYTAVLRLTRRGGLYPEDKDG